MTQKYEIGDTVYIPDIIAGVVIKYVVVDYHEGSNFYFIRPSLNSNELIPSGFYGSDKVYKTEKAATERLLKETEDLILSKVEHIARLNRDYRRELQVLTAIMENPLMKNSKLDQEVFDFMGGSTDYELFHKQKLTAEKSIKKEINKVREAAKSGQ